MKVYGYEKNSEDLLELEEMAFDCSLEELDEVIRFLQYVKEEHSKVKLEEPELCHSHMRDWKDNWDEDWTDVIVVTKFNTTKE